MLRILFACFAWILLSFPAAADEADWYAKQVEIRGAILAGDIEEVEQTFASTHARFLNGNAHPDEARIYFGLFGTTDPQILSFTRDWLKAYPNSPYAHTAQAWNDYKTGWLMRGEASYRATYPVAMEMFTELHESAWAHAMRAYQAEPRLLPASDALIRLGQTTRYKEESDSTFRHVMARDPNWGSLVRTIDKTQPNWGGSWDAAESLCNAYGKGLTELDDDPVRYCKLYAAGAIHAKFGDPLFLWLQDTLKREYIPALDYFRLRFATSPKATREDAQFAYDFLETSRKNGNPLYAEASDFDRVIAWKYDFPKIAEAHYRQMHQHARERLAENPYDESALKSLRTRLSVFEPRGENTTLETYVHRPTADEEVGYVRNQLAISPYNPDLWGDYAQLKYPFSDPASLIRRDLFLINAISFSNHDPYYLSELATSKMMQMKLYKKHQNTRPGSKWRDAWKTVKIEDDILCPMARASRLFDVICEYNGTSSCRNRRGMQEMVADVLKRNNAKRVCAATYSSPPEELAFYPVDVRFEEDGS